MTKTATKPARPAPKKTASRTPRAKAKPAAQPVNRYTHLDDAGAPTTATNHVAVEDANTGLTWAALPLPDRMTPAQAEAACAELNLAGHTDWRVPTIEELRSIIDYSRCNPAIDPVAFPNTPSTWFCTRTPYAASPSDFAWIVGFGGGHVYDGSRGSGGRVRAVRGSARQFLAL